MHWDRQGRRNWCEKRERETTEWSISRFLKWALTIAWRTSRRRSCRLSLALSLSPSFLFSHSRSQQQLSSVNCSSSSLQQRSPSACVCVPVRRSLHVFSPACLLLQHTLLHYCILLVSFLTCESQEYSSTNNSSTLTLDNQCILYWRKLKLSNWLLKCCLFLLSPLCDALTHVWMHWCTIVDRLSNWSCIKRQE